MVSIVTKIIKRIDYLYLVESIRVGPKVKQKMVKFIGKKRPISQHEFACMQLSYAREDWILTDYIDQLSYQEHAQMATVSKQYIQYVQRLDFMSKEKERERFLSMFIAESNAIEGSTLTHEETFNYLFNDISPKGKSKKELYMASNLLEAWKYVEKYQKVFPNTNHICQLHSLVNRGIETETTLGRYKPVQNYIGDVYTTSYLFVEERMTQMLSWIRKAYREVDDFEVAFQSHAQFEIIHPFVDGNGRVGRLLLNWLLLYKKCMPLAIPFSKRSSYISALQNSRAGKIDAISRFCYQEYVAQYEFVG